MKVLEKIYAGIFVIAILGITVLLNSPTVRNGSTLGQIAQQENNNTYNVTELDSVDDTILAVEDELENE